MKVRILIADDHAIVRQGLCSLLAAEEDFEIVGEAGDGIAVVEQARLLKPDVVIMDLTMPDLNGVEATRQIVKRLPDVQILILSMHANEAYIIQAVKAGAKGYLLKDSADTELLRGIDALSAGKSFFSPEVSKVMLDDYVRHLTDKGLEDRYATLSEREREIFQLIAEAKTNKEIAALLNVSPSTVETHRAHIMEKLDLHSAAEIVLYAVRRGVIR